MKTWPNTAILDAGLALEVAKHQLPRYLEQAARWLENTADGLDQRYGKPYPCTGTFMCLREGVRHKAGCPGRTEPFDRYIKGLRSC